MPIRNNWRAAEAQRGVENPKKQQLTNLTGDTGPINSTKFDLDMGDTDILNNSNSDNMGDTDLHSNINNSNSKNLGDTDLHSNANNINLNRNSNNCAKETSHILQTDILLNESNNSYAKKDSDNPSALNLNYILEKGDAIYRTHVQELTVQGLFQSLLLNFDEIPVKIEIPEGIFTINKQNILFGLALPCLQYQELTGFLTLQEAIQNCIKQSNKFLIMIGAICSAVCYYNHVYYFFDPHSHSECALNNPLDSFGKSILIEFADLHDLVIYLYAFYISLQIDLNSQFEILPVCISRKDTETVLNNQIKNYFKDQKLRNTNQCKIAYQYITSCGKEHSVSNEKVNQAVLSKSQVIVTVPKILYMKNYMQNRRKNKIFREKELKAKRYSRQN
ncbi:unnamed protein product [Mytilus coruscus]|uniref:Peptidase C76 domain-containing protein n=1 Tax=Mytilus coruscus TaxID=42192 RepID=A0A6J8CNB9_MYTCO|nr:unnamed protein product [Mytilus coruscus]